MVSHSRVGCRAFHLLLLTAATASRAAAERTSKVEDPSISDIPTLTSHHFNDQGPFDFDVFIIGAGSGGMWLSKQLYRQPNIRIGFAESREFGGTCVNRGCAPKKTLVRASAFETEMQEARARGIWDVTAELQWKNLQAWRKFKVNYISGLYKRGTQRRSDKITIFNQAVRVKSDHTIQIGDDPTATKKVRLLVLATGGRPRRDDFEGSNLPNVITSDEALELKEKPKSMLVVGAGYIAVELASFFLQVGTDVTMAVRSSMLRGFDEDVRFIVEDSLKKRGLDIRQGTIEKIVQQGNMLKVDLKVNKTKTQTLEVEYVLMAIGREPMTTDLGLDKANVELEQRSRKVPVNMYGQTQAPWIFAVGDIIAGSVELQPLAIKHAALLSKILSRETLETRVPIMHPAITDKHLATALFATPRAGSVGFTEEEARVKFRGDVTVLVQKEGPCGKDVWMWSLLKVIYHSKTEEVLGIHIAGKGVDETLQALAIVMALNPTWKQLKSALPVHPTFTEEILFMSKFRSGKGQQWRLTDCK